ncbi:response regulator [Pantoea sp. WMus005]|uniref:response regulator n=1 Tax=Pantoea sp. WMus005 TaxID=2750734 RepID=UPI0015CF843F|nr:response regulator [Pantoea sp. WMus005]NYS31925.1 response regulator [Pantoea sp. WMus005]
MPIEILVVEDNEFKRKRIVEVLSNEFESAKISECYSFTSAWQLIPERKYDLIVLDMSLPTFDKKESDSSGNFRVFGGKELARKLTKRKITSQFIFISQYKNFSDDVNSYTFESLKNELIEKYKSKCLGFLYYSNTKSEWRDELILIVKGISK